MDWIHLTHERKEWRALPQNVGKFLSNCTTVGFSKRARFHEVGVYHEM
jgi:hypothetical protein